MARCTNAARPNLVQLEARWNPATLYVTDSKSWDANVVGSLPWAVSRSNALPGQDTIEFAFGPGGLAAGAAVFNSTATLTVSDPVNISGPLFGGGNTVTLSGARPLLFGPPNGGGTEEGPPAGFPPSKVQNVTFDRCNSFAIGAPGVDGGAVLVTWGEVEFYACKFTNNRAMGDGGAIHVGTGATVHLNGFGGLLGPNSKACLFQDNTAAGDGGAVSNAGTVTIGAATFVFNDVGKRQR